MRVLKASDHKRMRWKNGGGETVEIAVHPANADLADFHWRVSVASVAVDGPFSVFPGVDRTLALLSGEGMELAVEGMGTHRLSPTSSPLAFPADAPTSARLLGGPITDLNIMTRRSGFTHRMQRLGGEGITANGPCTVLVAAEASLIAVNGEELQLERLDALVLESPARIERGNETAQVFVVEIDALSPSRQDYRSVY
ncbi:HutD/Ves family protein [Aureimonas psammosilenae]|uniref:HutD/Ves family protein n=1 Tax=Aureimonas psammosilenae TaxID=2495496 RepID=UPI0012610C29|nr:HutD family protein [Aureimonas psammosilenae]